MWIFFCLMRRGFSFQDWTSSLTPSVTCSCTHTQSRNLRFLVEKNKHASHNNTLGRLSNKCVHSVMRTLERKSLSGGKSLWRKVREAGRRLCNLPTLPPEGSSGEATNAVFLKELIIIPNLEHYGARHRPHPLTFTAFLWSGYLNDACFSDEETKILGGKWFCQKGQNVGFAVWYINEREVRDQFMKRL